MIPSCARRWCRGWLRSDGGLLCSPSRFRTAPSICGGLSAPTSRRKQPDWPRNSRLASARSLTTSSFNALALAGRDGHDVLVLNLSAFDAVDGAHCAASKCHRWLRRNAPSKEVSVLLIF